MKKSDCYVNTAVSKRALNTYFSTFRPGIDEIYSLEICRRDELLVRVAPSPYSVSDKREVYSLSKSFTSTAIGLLCDDGKLSTSDLIVDLFPDKLPEKISENLAKMRLSHVLSMNTGHSGCVMNSMYRAEDPVRAFLAQDVPYEPGTHFAYNTGATCLLSCLVQKITGETLVDFLTHRLFLPLGITGVSWNCIAAGENEGGCGVQISCDDIIKLGILYLSGGVYNGKRILSEQWCRTATSPISDNSSKESPDWRSGYGYQFWMNSQGGFRGDGSAGQLCFVRPDLDLVFAVEANVSNMQDEIDNLCVLAEHLFDDDGAAKAEVILPDYAPLGSAKRLAGFENVCFRLDENPMGWTQAYFAYDPTDDAMTLWLSDGVDRYGIRAGNGYYAESTMIAKELKPKILGLMLTERREICRLATSYMAEDGRLTFDVRYLNCPHRRTFTFACEEDELTMTFGTADQCTTTIKGRRI